MQNLTWKEIRAIIQRKHGIEADDSFTEPELIEICNEGINKVESRIINLQADYFLTFDTIDVVAGQTQYDLPSDIYASKIRRMFYQPDGHTERKLYRAKNLDNMVDKYKMKYIVLNSATGRKITLNNTPEKDGVITIYYTRNANRFTEAGGENQVCDIPEYIDAVIAWMSYRIEWKDKSPTTQLTLAEYNNIINELTETLAVAYNDEDHSIEPDLDFHNDHI